VTDPENLAIARCEHCHGRFLPHPGPCPRCGSTDLVPGVIPPTAVVLAATELLAPAAGWATPHRLTIAEGAESVRILAIGRTSGLAPGQVVVVRTENGLYYADAAAPPSAPGPPKPASPSRRH